jgi:hypothetical protein
VCSVRSHTSSRGLRRHAEVQMLRETALERGFTYVGRPVAAYWQTTLTWSVLKEICWSNYTEVHFVSKHTCFENIYVSTNINHYLKNRENYIMRSFITTLVVARGTQEIYHAWRDRKFVRIFGWKVSSSGITWEDRRIILKGILDK